MVVNQQRYELNDVEWEYIERHLPEPKKTGRPRSDPRTKTNGMLWILRTGAPWRDMPAQYGPYSTVYGWFKKCAQEGIIVNILEDLQSDADLQDVSIDSTCSKVHQHAAGAEKGAPNAESTQEIGMSRGGRNTKIHAVVDALGYPIHIHLSPGNIHDSIEASECLQDIPLSGSIVMGDKAYGSSAIRGMISGGGGTVCIPPKSNEKNPWDCDFDQYKERHLVECFFQKLKQFRSIATRYAKLASRFLAFVQLACILIWLS